MRHTDFIDPLSKIRLSENSQSLSCSANSYPIINGIPRFVGNENYAKAFGLQWNTFSRTQFDSYTGTTITEDRLRETIGYNLDLLKGKTILEAGCGSGRFTEILLKYGAKVFAFDFSNAVDANFKNNMPHPNLVLFQADIERIPFPDDFFDLTLCVGVLQHTPSTKKSLQELTRVTKNGGMIACDHYKFHAGMFTSLYLVYWWLIKRFTPERQLQVTEALTNFFFPLHWRFKDRPIIQKFLRRVSPINFYYGRFPLSKELLYEWSRLDTHDRNTDHFKRHITRKRFLTLMKEAGNNNIEVFVGGTGYVARGSKTV
jgi:ubiquinone/menaquinone biosynthesis C-methylase UbiE